MSKKIQNNEYMKEISFDIMPFIIRLNLESIFNYHLDGEFNTHYLCTIYYCMVF